MNHQLQQFTLSGPNLNTFYTVLWEIKNYKNTQSWPHTDNNDLCSTCFSYSFRSFEVRWVAALNSFWLKKKKGKNQNQLKVKQLKYIQIKNTAINSNFQKNIQNRFFFWHKSGVISSWMKHKYIVGKKNNLPLGTYYYTHQDHFSVYNILETLGKYIRDTRRTDIIISLGIRNSVAKRIRRIWSLPLPNIQKNNH